VHAQINSIEADRSSASNQQERSKAKEKVPMHQWEADETCQKTQRVDKIRPSKGKTTSALALRAPESWRGTPLE